MNTNVNKQLDDLFRVWGNGLCPGAQVLIRQHGETVYEKCFGYGNLENQLKIKNDSILHVASISKEFTVLSILLLRKGSWAWTTISVNMWENISTSKSPLPCAR